jgi:hypothetical protein
LCSALIAEHLQFRRADHLVLLRVLPAVALVGGVGVRVALVSLTSKPWKLRFGASGRGTSAEAGPLFDVVGLV